MKPTTTATSEPVFDFIVDEDAQPADLIPAVARLLIDLRRRRQATRKGEDDVSTGSS